ncbi:MAG: NADH-quinone oxidoreductase subunit A, partial [Gemmataceae bacterium]
PVTLAEHAALAAAVNDLGTPPGSVSGKPLAAELISAARERQVWRKLAGMGREEFEAHAQLKGDLTRALRQLGERGHDAVRSLSEPQLAALKAQASRLDATLKTIKDQQQAAGRETLAAIDKLPEAQRAALDKTLRSTGTPTTNLDNLTGSLRARPEQVDKWLGIKPLAELRRLPRGEIDLMTLTPPQWAVLEKALPDRVKALRELADRQLKGLASASVEAQAALAAGGSVPADVWNAFPPQVLSELAKLTPDRLKAFRALTPEGLAALEAQLTKQVKERADGLAWLALLEVLVFFGVLLVGFAYLWRRGDLAWVRSTAAEEKDEGGRMKEEFRIAV